MPHYQANKKGAPKQPYLKLVALVLVLVAIFLSKSVWDLAHKNKVSKLNSQRTLETLENLEQRQKMLQENINKLQTNEGVEEEIRRNFNVVREGEKVITIVDEQDKMATTATTTEMGFWRWLFHSDKDN